MNSDMVVEGELRVRFDEILTADALDFPAELTGRCLRGHSDAGRKADSIGPRNTASLEVSGVFVLRQGAACGETTMFRP